MQILLSRELDRLKQTILSLCSEVEDIFQKSLLSLKKMDLSLAAKLIERDSEIDSMEVDLEEDCLKILALYQPVAGDLRFIVSILKINNDLERIADLAVNIAERAMAIAKEPPIPVPFDFVHMGNLVDRMLRKSLDSLVRLEPDLARRVIILDEEVDTLHRETYELVRQALIRNPEDFSAVISYLGVSRHLERIADYATNIAEDVIYLTDGEIVRHKTDLAKEINNDPPSR
ncbi:MAG: phosphate signaling complex protein PhoU [Deltaproteobacteria bacterium]|nr:phosphate signaling complex protein PhoU [Deltaproteobacteria bacterium]